MHLVPRKRDEAASERESESVLGYVALCEEKWRVLSTQAFNSTGMVTNIDALVSKLYAYCKSSMDAWKESERVGHFPYTSNRNLRAKKPC